MQGLSSELRPGMDQGKQNVRRRRSLYAVLLMLALALLGGCGRAEQRAEQTSPQPLEPAPATPETTVTPDPTFAATAPPSPPVPIPPTLSDALRIPSITAAFIQTSVAANLQTVDTTLTAEAAWAQTPEPTLLPPADIPRLRERWPAAVQQAVPPSRLYLRRFSNQTFEPDTFWEVRLPELHTRRLPAVEEDGIDRVGQVSPDGRFLAYITGEQPERRLRLLDLVHDADLGLAATTIDSLPRCHQPIAWSPDGHTLAAITVGRNESGPVSQLQLYEPAVSLTPQTLLELRYPLDLLGWLDTNRLLLTHWDRKQHPAQLLSLDRQGHVAVIAELAPERLSCASLSPDGQDLIYTEGRHIKHLRLDTGQEEAFPWKPDELFWVGDGRTLLISRFDTARRVWLGSLDQLQESSRNQSGIFLSPPYQAVYKFGIIGVSPDNHTLVACERAPTDNPRIRTRESRTWLYSLPDNRWTLLRTNPEGPCDMVLGWSSAGGAR